MYLNSSKTIYKRVLAKTIALIIAIFMTLSVLGGATVIALEKNDLPPARIETEEAKPDTEVKAGKKEVIYSKLDPHGKPGELHIVNHFSLSEPGEIVDYGAYDEIIWLTGQQPEKNNEKIKIKADKGNYYYEGILSRKELPWSFNIEWFLDGKKVEPSSLSGAAGELRLKIASTAHPDYSDITENYSLQIGLAFPRDIVTDIEAEGSTIAEAGNNTMVNYVVLPGGNADIEVTAQVRDFYMPGISISAVKLDLSFEMPDVSDINEDMSQLIDAIEELKTGTDELNTGTSDLKEGVGELIAGVDTLSNEGQKLIAGIGTGTDGIKTYTDGVKSYVGGVTEYVSGVNKFTNGVNDLATGTSKLEAGAGELASGLKRLSSQSKELVTGSEQIQGALRTIGDNLSVEGIVAPTKEDLAKLDQLVKGSSAVKAGLSSLLAAFNGDGTAQNPGSIAGLKGISKGLGDIIDNLKAVKVDKVPEAAPIQGQQAWVAYFNQFGQPQGVDFATFFADNPAETGIMVAAFEQLFVTAAKSTNTAIASLNESMSTLIAGLGELKAGQDKIIKGLETAATGLQELVNNYTAIDAGINDLVSQIKGLSANLGEFPTLVKGLRDLSEQYDTFHAGLKQYTGGVSKIYTGVSSTDPNNPGLKTGLSQLSTGLKSLKTASKEVRQGSDKITAGGKKLTDGSADLASGIAELKKGTTEYVNGVRKLGDGMREYRDGLVEYQDGVEELAAGTTELADEVQGMDQKLLDEINEKIDELTNKDYEPASFVSPLNTEVESVQFVLLTEEIPEPAKAVVEVPQEEDKNFWERLKAIFGG